MAEGRTAGGIAVVYRRRFRAWDGDAFQETKTLPPGAQKGA